MPGRARGVAPEEPAAENLHGGVCEGGELHEPGWTYTRTKLETADRAKESLKPTEVSSTRKGPITLNGGDNVCAPTTVSPGIEDHHDARD
jgi:hypothetical protein